MKTVDEAILAVATPLANLSDEEVLRALARNKEKEDRWDSMAMNWEALAEIRQDLQRRNDRDTRGDSMSLSAKEAKLLLAILAVEQEEEAYQQEMKHERAIEDRDALETGASRCPPRE